MLRKTVAARGSHQQATSESHAELKTKDLANRNTPFSEAAPSPGNPRGSPAMRGIALVDPGKRMGADGSRTGR